MFLVPHGTRTPTQVLRSFRSPRHCPESSFLSKDEIFNCCDEKIVLIYFRVARDKIKAGHDRVHVASSAGDE